MRPDCAVLFAILLIGVASLAGCTGSPPAPAATPTPLPVVTFPAIPTTATTAPVIAPYVWPVTETRVTAATATPIPVVTFPLITPLATTAPVTTTQVWPGPETPVPGIPSAKTYFFHGTGDYEDFTFTTDFDATWAFRMDPGAGTFLVSLQDDRGNEIAVLPPAGTKTIRLKAGDYHFDIAADAPWYITMSST